MAAAITTILVAVIGVVGTWGGIIISHRLGKVEKMVNGRLTRLIEMIEERDAKIEKLQGERRSDKEVTDDRQP